MATYQQPRPNPASPAPNAFFGESPPPLPQAREQAVVDDSITLTGYANFCRVTGTPEEVIVDFGLTGQHQGDPARPVVVTQRVVTNLYTAKRLVQVLEMVIERHEAMFGALETDVQRRVRRAAPNP